MINAIIIVNKGKEGEKKIPVQYNPPEYSISMSPKYAQAHFDANRSVLSFVKEAESEISMKLTVDGFSLANTRDETKAQDITSHVNEFRKLTLINEKLHRPPDCSFVWGSLTFSGFATKVSVNYTMFSSEGKPLRATIDLTITKKTTESLALESPDRTKKRVLTEDMRLYMLANEAYNDCGMWRYIADANGIRNPRRIKAGTMLKIPPLEAEQ